MEESVANGGAVIVTPATSVRTPDADGGADGFEADACAWRWPTATRRACSCRRFAMRSALRRACAACRCSCRVVRAAVGSWEAVAAAAGVAEGSGETSAAVAGEAATARDKRARTAIRAVRPAVGVTRQRCHEPAVTSVDSGQIEPNAPSRCVAGSSPAIRSGEPAPHADSPPLAFQDLFEQRLSRFIDRDARPLGKTVRNDPLLRLGHSGATKQGEPDKHTQKEAEQGAKRSPKEKLLASFVFHG